MIQINLINQAMSLIHIGACYDTDEYSDDNKLNKVLLYMIWALFIILGPIIGFILSSVMWGVGLTVFIILIGICIILWNKENKKVNNNINAEPSDNCEIIENE